MIQAIAQTIVSLTNPGGLMRVRAVLAMGFTVIGGVYLLQQQAMPPGEFNMIWSGAVGYYYGTRGGHGNTEERSA